MGPWPWEEQNGNITDSEIYETTTIAVFRVLDSWFRALEDGSHVYRLPDPDYQRPGGKSDFTEEQLEQLVTEALDEWFNNPQNQNYAKTTRGIWHDAGPEFTRLELPQRLALAQELEQALVSSSTSDPETL